MNKLKILGILILSGMCTCCSNEEDSTQAEEAQVINELLEEIQSLASSVDCIDASDWLYTSYGSKACGGPQGYIAYPVTIDGTDFLNKVEAHRRAQSAFNEKWDIISDCLLVGEPSGITCENGSPVFEY